MTKKQAGEKTGVQKLRERFFEIKKNIKSSKELRDVLKKKPQEHEGLEESNKKVARPLPKEVEV